LPEKGEYGLAPNKLFSVLHLNSTFLSSENRLGASIYISTR